MAATPTEAERTFLAFLALLLRLDIVVCNRKDKFSRVTDAALLTTIRKTAHLKNIQITEIN